MRHSFSLLSIATITLLIGHSVLITSAQRQQPSKPIRQDGADKTHIEHSKLYKQYSGRGDLRTLAAKASGDVEVANGAPQKVFFPNAVPLQLGDFLRELTNKSDAVVIGVVKDQASFLTAEGTFVFTDYDLTVEQILKNNADGFIRPFDDVCVTRPGGNVQFEGHKIRALDESLAPLAIGSRYLLFLDYVPTTRAYKAFNSQGSFRIEGNRAAKLTTEQLPSDLDRGADIDVLAAFIRTAAN